MPSGGARGSSGESVQSIVYGKNWRNSADIGRHRDLILNAIRASGFSVVIRQSGPQRRLTLNVKT